MGRKRTLLIAVALVAAGLAVRGARVVASRHLLPTRGGQWIWAPEMLHQREGTAFLAVREFELDPETADLRIHMLADEAYIAYLNGRRFGSGAYIPGARLDAYAVQGLVRAGSNRLVVELRSDRGAGGFLATATDGVDNRLLFVTDDQWRIHRRGESVLFQPGTAPVVWETAPTGAWGAPGPGPIKPNFTDAADLPGALRPVAGRAIREEPRVPGGSGRRGRLFDFGRTVTGYLSIDGLDPGPRRILGSFGDVEGEVRDGIRIIRLPGQRTWTEAEVTRFRYARFWGALPDGFSPSVIPVTRELAAHDAAHQAARREGVFGLPVPSQP